MLKKSITTIGDNKGDIVTYYGDSDGRLKALENNGLSKLYDVTKHHVLNSMAEFAIEYAKEVAIAFAKWCMENTAQDLNVENEWFYQPNDSEQVDYLTDEELFNQFLQETNKSE